MIKTRRLSHYENCPYLKGESKLCTCGMEEGRDKEPREVDEKYLDRVVLGVKYRGEGDG